MPDNDRPEGAVELVAGSTVSDRFERAEQAPGLAHDDVAVSERCEVDRRVVEGRREVAKLAQPQEQKRPGGELEQVADEQHAHDYGERHGVRRCRQGLLLQAPGEVANQHRNGKHLDDQVEDGQHGSEDEQWQQEPVLDFGEQRKPRGNGPDDLQDESE